MQGREKKKRDRREEHTREAEKNELQRRATLKNRAAPKARRSTARREVGWRRNFLLVIAPAGRHDSPWQSQSPHLKGFLFWGNKAVQHTQ